MKEIQFELGRGIAETARASGIANFETGDIAGLVSYAVADVPGGLAGRYIKAGFEVEWHPLFAFTMYADHEHHPSSSVDSVVLQLDSSVRSHPQTHAFVDQTIAQFAKGRWRRYRDAVWETLLTGRSSLLDEFGQIAGPLLTIDPAYAIPSDLWPAVMQSTPVWRWFGDDVLASLRGRFDADDPLQPPAYSFSLTFDRLSMKLEQEAEELARQNQAGDAKGWNSTARYEAAKKERAALNRRLESAALARGDSVANGQ